MIDPGLIEVAVAALGRARSIVLSRRVEGYRDKTDRDPVTAVDLAVERELRGALRAAASGIGFLGEETGRNGTQAAYWVLDPVDGTVNLAQGLPLCAVSLGLIAEGRAQLAAVDLPFLGLRYTAVEHGGIRCHGGELRRPTATRLQDAVVALGDYATGLDATQRNAERLHVTARLASTVRRVRMLGSAALDLAWVAHGRLDAAVVLANKPWESAVGALLVREAGGVVLDVDGRPHTLESTSTVATSPSLAPELIELLRS